MSSKNEYVLGRGYLAALRLNAQHLLWKDQIGFLIHPRVPITENIKIADVGAGTGIWLLETSKMLSSSSELHGYDVDLSKFPPKQWLPQNVSTFTWDAFSDVPAEMIGKYDIVHLGIFMLLIANNNPVPIIQNLMKLLKPGGYLQWDEIDWATRRIIRADPSFPEHDTRAMLDYVSQWEDALGPKSWIADLPSAYSSQGLKNVAFERIPMPREYLIYDTDKHLTSYEEFSRSFLDEKSVSEGEHFREMIEKASQECHKGVAITADMVIAVAQKPFT